MLKIWSLSFIREVKICVCLDYKTLFTISCRTCMHIPLKRGKHLIFYYMYKLLFFIMWKIPPLTELVMLLRSVFNVSCGIQCCLLLILTVSSCSGGEVCVKRKTICSTQNPRRGCVCKPGTCQDVFHS